MSSFICYLYKSGQSWMCWLFWSNIEERVKLDNFFFRSCLKYVSSLNFQRLEELKLYCTVITVWWLSIYLIKMNTFVMLLQENVTWWRTTYKHLLSNRERCVSWYILHNLRLTCTVMYIIRFISSDITWVYKHC